MLAAVTVAPADVCMPAAASTLPGCSRLGTACPPAPSGTHLSWLVTLTGGSRWADFAQLPAQAEIPGMLMHSRSRIMRHGVTDAMACVTWMQGGSSTPTSGSLSRESSTARKKVGKSLHTSAIQGSSKGKLLQRCRLVFSAWVPAALPGPAALHRVCLGLPCTLTGIYHAQYVLKGTRLHAVALQSACGVAGGGLTGAAPLPSPPLRTLHTCRTLT